MSASLLQTYLEPTGILFLPIFSLVVVGTVAVAFVDSSSIAAKQIGSRSTADRLLRYDPSLG